MSKKMIIEIAVGEMIRVGSSTNVKFLNIKEPDEIRLAFNASPMIKIGTEEGYIKKSNRLIKQTKGQKFYIQPIIGDLLVVEIIAIIGSENEKKVRLCVTCTDEPKVHRVRQKSNVKGSRQAASPARAGNQWSNER